MTRILADLPDEYIKWLDRLVASRASHVPTVLTIIIRWYRQYIESDK